MGSRGHSVLDVPHIYVPEGALDTWHAAKVAAGAGLSQTSVYVLGDSITQGFYSTNWRTRSWQGIVRAALQARYGAAGEFINLADCGVTGQSTAQGPAQGTLNLADYQWMATLGTPTSVWVTATMAGLQTRPISAANGDVYVLTPALGAFTDFDLVGYQDPFSGSFTVDLNTGTVGAPVWVAQTAGSGIIAGAGSGAPPDNAPPLPTPYGVTATPAMTWFGAGSSYRRYARFYGWSPGGTGVQVRMTSTSANVIYLTGANIFPAGRNAPGLFWTKMAQQGRAALAWTNPLFPTLQPYFTAAASAFEDWSPQPSLVLVALGVNDMQGANGLDSLAYGLEQIAQSATRGGASLVFVAPYVGTQQRSNFPNPFTNGTLWGQYLQVQRMLAQAYNAVLVDVHSLVGQTGSPLTSYLYFDGANYNPHPSDAGHALIAQALLSIL